MVTIDDIRMPIANEFVRYEKAFAQTMQSDEPLIREVLRYIHAKQGKQLRPTLVLLAADLCHGVTDKSIQSAIAIEMLHNASLIHDDVVDNSPIRHGSDAIHSRWTNKIAVLMGDFLLAKAITCIADVRILAILQTISALGASLSQGELMQLHHDHSMWISEEDYFRIIDHKTAQLFAACTEVGAQSSGATIRQTTALREFGRQLGICFQLKDDVFDYSDSDELGKPTMSDIADGKATLPLIISLQRAPKDEAEHIREIAEQLANHNHNDNHNGNHNHNHNHNHNGNHNHNHNDNHNQNHNHNWDEEQEIKSFVLRYDGIRYTYAQMEAHKKSAEQALSIFHDNATKRSLLALLDYTIHRVF